MPATLISVQQYLQTSYHPDCDYVDGELEERNVGELTHNKMQRALIAWFLAHMTEWKIEPYQEQCIQVSSSRYRVCDTVLLQPGIEEEVTITPPLLCIEIMSPDDRISRAKNVLADYAAMGVAQSWLIDPLRREAFVYDAQGLHVVEQDRMQLPGSPIYLILSDLFAVLDKK